MKIPLYIFYEQFVNLIVIRNVL